MKKELQHLESFEFDATLNIASSLKVAVSVLEQDENVQKLINETDSFLQAEIALTLLEVLKDNDVNFQHPHDSRMAAYLYILSQTNRALAIVCAIQIYQGLNCFWSRKFAEGLIDAYFLSGYRENNANSI